jgi:hypothetical protein
MFHHIPADPQAERTHVRMWDDSKQAYDYRDVSSPLSSIEMYGPTEAPWAGKVAGKVDVPEGRRPRFKERHGFGLVHDDDRSSDQISGRPDQLPRFPRRSLGERSRRTINLGRQF